MYRSSTLYFMRWKYSRRELPKRLQSVRPPGGRLLLASELRQELNDRAIDRFRLFDRRAVAGARDDAEDRARDPLVQVLGLRRHGRHVLIPDEDEGRHADAIQLIVDPFPGDHP